MNHQPLFSIPFLASRGEIDFKTFKSSTEAALLLERLKNWHERHKLKETATNAAFISLFFAISGATRSREPARRVITATRNSR